MEASRDIKERLSRLRIDKDQRPDAGPRSRKRVWIVAGVVVGVGAIGLGLWGGRLGTLMSGLGQPPEVRLIRVTARTAPGAPPILTATGKIVSDHRVNVATKVSGQIVGLSFEQGDRVERGQIIANVETVNYQARRDNAAAKLEQSRARLEFARIKFERIKGLRERGNAPDIEYADTKSVNEAAKAQVDADQAELDEAQWRLDECAVKAPITGVVLERNVGVGDFVAAEGGFGGMANSQFAVIADMNSLRVEVDINEMDIARIGRGMPCRITPDAYKDRTYDGHVMWLDPGANYSKGTVQVKVRVGAPDEYLRIEGTARVDFLTEEPRREADGGTGSIWLSRAAIAEGDRPDSGRVFVYNDGRLHEQSVTLGRRSDRKVEILSGLEPGARVAAKITDETQDGRRVRPAGSR